MTRARAWLVCGAPGAGKSVLGAALARELGACLLDQDVLTGPLTRVIAGLVGADPEDLDDPEVRRALGDARYDALLATARENLGVGRDVVVVAPFTHALASAQAAATVAKLGVADVRVVWATCPPSERARRLRARGAPRDRRKLSDPAGTAGLVARPPAVAHTRVDTTAPLATQVTAALRPPR